MKPAPGLSLNNRYRLERQIAVGGMGEVWVAHDLALARDVAIKVLREEFAGDPGFLERFRTEARNAASLSHPNIAQPYDYGEIGGSGFIVMELVPGEPMSDLLAREPVLPPDRLLPILAQTARALHAAHVAGVVHRDVKPGNILLGRAGRVKITDFGVSLATNQISLTATGMVMGTAQYLSPEQALGRPATPSSDIYSLGVVAYEALAGKRPFTGEAAVDIAVAHVNRPVPPLPRAVEPELGSLVMRMLAKDPLDRPRSAASLARTFDTMVASTPPAGIPAAPGLAATLGTPTTAASSASPASGPAEPVRPEAPRAPSVPAPQSAATGSPQVVAEPPIRRSPSPAAATAAGPVDVPTVDPVVVTAGLVDADHGGFAPPVHPAPPSFPPRRDLRQAPAPAPTGRRSAGSRRRRRSVRWPLIVLVLLLLALFGAWVADKIVGATAQDEGADSAGGLGVYSTTVRNT